MKRNEHKMSRELNKMANEGQHLDVANNGYEWLSNAPTGTPEALKRLGYRIADLERQGIYYLLFYPAYTLPRIKSEPVAIDGYVALFVKK